ncbi:MAG: hypothetical protein HUU21_03075 [Polyangiaceae bacterium]|nr:hypothetical protein [Polyangiaceae bacterium]NUQ72512.1 hypothetical protein [Polyangiaceae bacterium]
MTAHQLCQASVENLERLARFMGVPMPPPISNDYKFQLVAAILRFEMRERMLRDDDEC